MRILASLAGLAALIGTIATASAQSVPAANPGGGRIVGGHNASVGEAPWMVEIYSITKYTPKILREDHAEEALRDGSTDFIDKRPSWDYQHVCGGVLIAADWVLTAGHCVQDVPDAIIRNDTIIPYFKAHRRLRLGSLAITQGSGSSCVPLQVVVYPGAGDVALIRIDPHACNPQPAPGGVAPIALAGRTDLSQYDANTQFRVYGWGMTLPRDPNALSAVIHATRSDDTAEYLDPNAPVLQVAGPIFFVDRATCRATSGYAKWLTNTLICAGVSDGRMDQCNGDSGGPLVIETPVGLHKQVPQLVGIVHGGSGCGLADTPGTYEFAPHYLAWIARTIGHGHAAAGQALLVKPPGTN